MFVIGSCHQDLYPSCWPAVEMERGVAYLFEVHQLQPAFVASGYPWFWPQLLCFLVHCENSLSHALAAVDGAALPCLSLCNGSEGDTTVLSFLMLFLPGNLITVTNYARHDGSSV